MPAQRILTHLSLASLAIALGGASPAAASKSTKAGERSHLAASTSKRTPAKKGGLTKAGKPAGTAKARPTLRAARADSVAGYVVAYHAARNTVDLRLGTGEVVEVELDASSYPEVVRNLGESFQAPGKSLPELMTPGRYLFVEGIVPAETEGEAANPTKPRQAAKAKAKGRPKLRLQAKRVLLDGAQSGRPRFEEPGWWTSQVSEIADFYLRSQFPEGVYDFRKYRTYLGTDGKQLGGQRQETATLSRMLYGLASAYMLTGDERYYEAARAGTDYMRENLREEDASKGVVFWNHALDINGSKRTKVRASTFDDDKDAIPAYEQIYALAGLVQTYRITGDPRYLRDADMTIKLFQDYFYDKKQGGYFSHVDPINFDPRAKSLGRNTAKKNWNSVGDHAPAYLISLYLATGDQKHLDMLVETADTIATKFPEFEKSPFVQERFDENWQPDRTWGWQQDRAVVGHNTKISWNLRRIFHLRAKPEYVKTARRLADTMATEGVDLQRGGWYDVVERQKDEGDALHQPVWHDRKAWWQQEQGVLAYLINGGSDKNPGYLKVARETSAFYNAHFLDHDSGGVNFMTTADGKAYRQGTEQLKGSHSISAYHSIELGFLAQVYTNLLVTKEPLDLFFKPKLGGFKDNVLRVAPDALPPGSVRIDKVWVDGKPYTNFDADKLTVTLPPAGAGAAAAPTWVGNPAVTARDTAKVKVRLVAVP